MAENEPSKQLPQFCLRQDKSCKDFLPKHAMKLTRALANEEEQQNNHENVPTVNTIKQKIMQQTESPLLGKTHVTVK